MIRTTVTWVGTAPGLPFYSSHYFEGDTQGEADAAVAAVVEFWQALSTLTTSAIDAVVSPEVEVVDPASGQVTGVFQTAGGTAEMTASGEPLPWTTQGLVRWRTGVFVGGREIRGRTFLPGPLEANNAVGVPASSYFTLANTAIAGFLTDAAAAGGLVVYSRTHGQAALVAAGNVWTQWATVRSRRD